MNRNQDPVRWADASGEVPRELTDAFRRARSDVPSPEELARVAASLGAVIGGPGGLPGTGGAMTGQSAAGKAAAGKAAAGKAAAGKAVAASKATTVAKLGVVLLVLGGGPAALSRAGVFHRSDGRDSRPADVAAPERWPDRAPRSAAPSSDVEPDATADGSAVEASDRGSAGGQAGISSAEPTASSSVRGAGPTGDDLAAEAALLLRARRALDRDPSLALALTREHARRFANGKLVHERTVIGAEAEQHLQAEPHSPKSGADASFGHR